MEKLTESFVVRGLYQTAASRMSACTFLQVPTGLPSDKMQSQAELTGQNQIWRESYSISKVAS